MNIEYKYALNQFMDDFIKHTTEVKKCFIKIINNLEDQNLLTDKVRNDLYKRANSHDQSKLSDIEKNGYIDMNMELKGVDYGTTKFNKIRKKYDYVIHNHYDVNPHHPEHYENGYEEMSDLDKIEMCCDWIGAMKSRNTVDKYKESIEYNFKRFNIPQHEQNKLLALLDFLVDRRYYIGSSSHIYDLLKDNE